jgi:hypothetical protein
MSDERRRQLPRLTPNVATSERNELATFKPEVDCVEAVSDCESKFMNVAVQTYLQVECGDARAMLFDGGANIQAKLCRQLASAHEAAIRLLDRAQSECNTVETARLMNVAVRLMTAFQQGVVTLRQLQVGGGPIAVQNVRVLAENAVVTNNIGVPQAACLSGPVAEK